ncbi:MAG: OmpA family protein [Desulfobacula sp.]|jgi:chemotaxis protein MotB
MRDNTYNNSFITYDDEATWLVTYADLMTLLLVFFVLLYTITSLETNRYKKAVEVVKVQIENNEEPIGLLDLVKIPGMADKQITLEEITGLKSREKALFEDLTRFVTSSNEKENLSTRMMGDKIIVAVNGKALFGSGTAVLNPSAVHIFNELIDIFYEYPDYNINIKGHTDNVPISTDVFPSNWELSAVRATTVLKILISRGIKPERLTATGYGDVLPLVPNTSEENRAQNRRVEFVLEKEEAQN